MTSWETRVSSSIARFPAREQHRHGPASEGILAGRPPGAPYQEAVPQMHCRCSARDAAVSPHRLFGVLAVIMLSGALASG
jgi:hypothetical protein